MRRIKPDLVLPTYERCSLKLKEKRVCVEKKSCTMNTFMIVWFVVSLRADWHRPIRKQKNYFDLNQLKGKNGICRKDKILASFEQFNQMGRAWEKDSLSVWWQEDWVNREAEAWSKRTETDAVLIDSSSRTISTMNQLCFERCSRQK